MTLLYAAQCPTCSDTTAIYVRSIDGSDLVCTICAGAVR